jgi:radical SAM superfamily enzyme YgiQ (UPF0313 family)
MKLLLINPKFPESFWSFKWVVDNILPEAKTLNPPLGLATIAALTPPDWEVEIIDENIERTPLKPDADIIGICGMGVQFDRQKELLTYYRKQGYFVAAGGSYASLCPEAYEPLANTVISGEAEYIWPEFCRDFEKGYPRKLYKETGVVSLEDSPVPRFDLLKMNKYRAATMQFSRGCPFQCEFCDIIIMFGRKPRTKPVASIARELDELRKQGVHSVFFIDDNLIGNKLRAKELLRFLRDYQLEHDYEFRFGTEASLNLAYDDELLELFRDAHFEWVFIGIESPDEESLKETKKVQNTNHDILASVRKIYSYGIEIIAGFIIGFDNDTKETFDKQYDFIMESGIQSAMIGLLTAIPKTPLYERLKKENRLVEGLVSNDNSKLETNVLPKRMSYDEMIAGYRELHYRLFNDRAIARRIRKKVRYLANPSSSVGYSFWESMGYLRRFLVRGLLPGGISRFYHFAGSLPLHKPRLIPIVIMDWMAALSTRDYIDRHFVQEFQEDKKKVLGYVEKLHRAYFNLRNKGALSVSVSEVGKGAAAVSISLRGLLEKDVLKGVTQNVENILRNTKSTINLQIREIQQVQAEHMKSMLDKLAKYGDRIHIWLDEESRNILPIDSSVFNLVLMPESPGL